VSQEVFLALRLYLFQITYSRGQSKIPAETLYSHNSKQFVLLKFDTSQYL